ncbi:MAG TPA: non-ribosomal peptide synthetase [Streptosporangiaceae bacterium]|nr:non-ribosomal peptide synthetase [Streptosporangiaceae bacterium]
MTTQSTFLDLFRQQARTAPDAMAIATSDSRLTYRQVEVASDRIAAVLREHGVQPAEAVAISVPKVDVAICAMLGAMKARAAVLLLDPDHPRARRVQQVTYARCVLVISDDEDKLTHATPNVSPSSSPAARPFRASAAEPGDPAYIVYTSGSTAAPKGVVCGHASLANVALAQRTLLGVGKGDRVAVNAPVTVDAFYFEVILALAAGARLQVPDPGERRAGPRFRRFLRERGITVLVCTPTKLRTLEPADHHGLRLVISAGEELDTGLARRWAPGRRLINAYGPTEATIWTTMADISGTESEIPLGTAIPGCRVDVLRHDLSAAATGEVGELVIGGAGVALGYLHDPGSDAFITMPDGDRAYRTGDRAVRRRDGSLVFAGRIDDQVKVSGFRIELGEIRHHLLQHPAVGDAAVRVDGGRLIAYATAADPGTRPEGPEALKRFLSGRLPEYMLPSSYIWLDTMPATNWGKADVASLPGAAGAASSQRGWRPTETPIEQFLADAVGEMLDFTAGADDDLFLIGLDSISVAKLMNKVNTQFDVELEHIEVFDNPTISALAKYIADRVAAAGSVRQ